MGAARRMRRARERDVLRSVHAVAHAAVQRRADWSHHDDQLTEDLELAMQAFPAETLALVDAILAEATPCDDCGSTTCADEISDRIALGTHSAFWVAADPAKIAALERSRGIDLKVAALAKAIAAAAAEAPLP